MGRSVHVLTCRKLFPAPYSTTSMTHSRRDLVGRDRPETDTHGHRRPWSRLTFHFQVIQGKTMPEGGRACCAIRHQVTYRCIYYHKYNIRSSRLSRARRGEENLSYSLLSRYRALESMLHTVIAFESKVWLGWHPQTRQTPCFLPQKTGGNPIMRWVWYVNSSVGSFTL